MIPKITDGFSPDRCPRCGKHHYGQCQSYAEISLSQKLEQCQAGNRNLYKIVADKNIHISSLEEGKRIRDAKFDTLETRNRQLVQAMEKIAKLIDQARLFQDSDEFLDEALALLKEMGKEG